MATQPDKKASFDKEQEQVPQDAWYVPKPLNERPSQHVGAHNFVSWFGKLALTGVAVGAVSWAGAKIFKPQIPIPKTMQLIGEKYGVWQDTHFAPSSYFGFGTKVGVLVKAFMMWRKGEAEHLGVMDINKDVKNLSKVIPTTEEIVEDNVLASKMIDYEKRQQEALQKQPQAHILAQATQHQGVAAMIEQQHTL